MPHKHVHIRGHKLNITQILWIAVPLIVLSGLIYWGYRTYQLSDQLEMSRAASASSTATFLSIVGEQRVKIAAMTSENQMISALLSDEERRRIELEQVKATNEKKIDTLTKLTTIDPELLKKYSKVFFLSENYIPPALVDISPEYKVLASKDLKVLDKVNPFLEEMLAAAKKDGVDVLVTSAFRSFEEQKGLKSTYNIIYGAGTANQFSADQGYSEHQMGTTLDFTTSKLKSAVISFEDTAAFAWLNKNAYKYGFIISYPEENTFYEYEPWHWRFVGRGLATYLHGIDKYFYQLDQRELDTYLIQIFD